MGVTELSCVICQEDFSEERVPRNLGCGHSLCTACIDNVILSENGKLCPECRKPFSANNASDLTVNYLVLRVIRSTKSPHENLLGATVRAIPETDSETKTKEEYKLFIDDTDSGPIWRENPSKFNCTVSSPKKLSKYHGMKTYIAYSVIPSFSSKRVLRRYTQFVWLRNQLIATYPLTIMPPLPKNQILGRFSEEVIEYRMCMLQSWLERICRHPVMSQNDVLNHFITVSNKKVWKTSKRKAANDKKMNDSFYSTIKRPNGSVDMVQMKQKLEEYDYFSRTLGKSLKLMHNVCIIQTNNYRKAYKQNNDKVSHSLMELNKAFSTDITNCGLELPAVISHVSEVYSDIGKIYVEEPKQDWGPLQNMLYEYQGLTEGFNKILSITRKSISNINEAASSEEAITAVYTFQAEAAYFHQERTSDFKKCLKSFLGKQVDVHQRITDQLKETLEKVHSEDIEEA